MTNTEFDQELIVAKAVLFSFALKLTKNYQDAQDLFQDGAIRGFRYCARFETGTNFRAWMSTIIRNTFINNFRASRRKPKVNAPLDTFLIYVENRNIVANQGEMNLRIQEVYGTLDELDDKYSVPFIMHRQGYEYKEIGQQLSLPIGTVKSRLYTARQELKKMIIAKNQIEMN